MTDKVFGIGARAQQNYREMAGVDDIWAPSVDPLLGEEVEVRIEAEPDEALQPEIEGEAPFVPGRAGLPTLGAAAGDPRLETEEGAARIPPPPPPPPAEEPAIEFVPTAVVQAGDTAFKLLERRYDSGADFKFDDGVVFPQDLTDRQKLALVDLIAKANPEVPDINQIQPGQVLNVPSSLEIAKTLSQTATDDARAALVAKMTKDLQVEKKEITARQILATPAPAHHPGIAIPPPDTDIRAGMPTIPLVRGLPPRRQPIGE